MTFPTAEPEAFLVNLIDNLQHFVEAEQDAPGVDPWDKDPDYIWKPPGPNRDGGFSGVSENGGPPG